MIEQVDWNFCCKVADRMESDRQEGITALSNSAILLGGSLNYVEIISNYRQAGTQANRTLPRTQALFSGVFSGVTGLVSALISGLAS